LVRLKVFDAVKLQLNTHLAAVVLKLILYRIGQSRLHSRENLVKVVGIDLDKLAVLKSRKRFLGLSDKIAQDTDHKWQFFQFDCPTDLHIVSDLNARRTYAIDLVLQTLFCWH